MQEDKRIEQRFKNMVNNAQGHYFENFIAGGCLWYKNKEIANIEKMPEPFRVMKKNRDGTALVRFTKHAQPDFIGTLEGGRAIVFEAKHTTTERMRYEALTATQIEALEKHYKAGAMVGVCVGILDDNFFIPWEVWRNMKKIYGRKYITATDIEEYRVEFNGIILFLNYVHKGNRIDEREIKESL